MGGEEEGREVGNTASHTLIICNIVLSTNSLVSGPSLATCLLFCHINLICFIFSPGSGVPRKKGCTSSLLPATAGGSRVTSSGGQDPPADSRKKRDDEDTGNESEWRNGLDGEGQTGAVGVTCGLKEERLKFHLLCSNMT